MHTFRSKPRKADSPRLPSSRRTKRQAARLVDDVEAFVQGRLADVLHDSGRPVPTWCWTNLLAHGTEAELRAARFIRQPHPFGKAEAWSRARASAARLVLDLAPGFGGLPEAQACALRPLEERLLLASDERMKPTAWLALVRSTMSTSEAR